MKTTWYLMVGAALLATTPALAEVAIMSCGQTGQVEQHLERKYSEHRVAHGLGGGALGIAELWLSENQTWTLVVKFMDGRSCVLAGGTRWRWAMADQVEAPPL